VAGISSDQFVVYDKYPKLLVKRHYTVLLGKPEKRDHVEDPDVDGRILSWIFRKREVGALNGSSWLRIRTGTCECGNEHSGSIKCGEFLD
jgi:hypothetical protein